MAAIGIAVQTASRAGEIRKATGAIRSVDAKARLISISTSGGKNAALDLEVSRKARIAVDGAEASLDDLRVGQEATVSYDADLGVATEVRATGPGESAPEIVNLSDVDVGMPEFAPWLSGDGRDLYWTTQAGPGQEAWIWMAHRKGPGSPFKGARRLFHGAVPTLTDDGLTLVFIDRASQLHVATRRSTNEPFGKPIPIGSLRRGTARYRMPCLSGDGRTLYF